MTSFNVTKLGKKGFQALTQINAVFLHRDGLVYHDD